LDIVERKASSSEGESIDALHQQALLHFEIAIYCAWQHQKWERLQAYVANLAFHMQEMIPLGLCNVLQVFSWYELTMLYEDRLNAGQDSAWTFIFLAEFLLDHEAALRAELRKRADGEDSLTIIENLHPAKQEFYLRAIERLRYCGDARQVAIAWICYGRFAQKTMGDAVVQQTVKNKLVELFRENPKVKVGLMKERYEGHLARLM
jgi:hypothetical protein